MLAAMSNSCTIRQFMTFIEFLLQTTIAIVLLNSKNLIDESTCYPIFYARH